MQTAQSFRKYLCYIILFFLSRSAQAKFTGSSANGKDSIVQPVRVHPDNPKCFLFRGAPMVFLTATEHYGSVMNRPFRYKRYLADERELTDNSTGQPIRGNIRFDLPEGSYEIRTYSPETGLYSPGVSINGSKDLQFNPPEIQGDLVVRITRIN